MEKGLKYCSCCMEAIQLTELDCVHCGQKQKQSNIAGKLSTMLLMGLIMPGCPKPAETSDAEKNAVEDPVKESNPESAYQQGETAAEKVQPYIPAEGTIKALYGVEPVEVRKLSFTLRISLDVDGEKTEADLALEQQLQSRKQALEACYNQGFRPGASYPSELKISITQKGGVVNEVVLEEEQDSKLGECLQKEIGAWELPVDSVSVIKIRLNI